MEREKEGEGCVSERCSCVQLDGIRDPWEAGQPNPLHWLQLQLYPVRSSLWSRGMSAPPGGEAAERGGDTDSLLVQINCEYL